MRRAALSVGLVLTAALAFAAHGQPVTTLKDGRYPGAVDTVEGEGAVAARRALNIFGRCIARTRSALTTDILAMPLQSDEQNNALRRGIGGAQECLGANEGRELRFMPPVLTAAMAEYMVAVELGGRDVEALAGLTDAQIAAMGAAPRNIQEDVATCMVTRDPAGALALARTEPDSPGEGAVIARLAPNLGPCLPEGVTFTVNRSSLRLFAAGGLYRLMTARARAERARR